MFAIDGVKLASNASKHKGGTHVELAHDAETMEKADDKMLEAHHCRDNKSEQSSSQEDER